MVHGARVLYLQWLMQKNSSIILPSGETESVNRQYCTQMEQHAPHEHREEARMQLVGAQVRTSSVTASHDHANLGY